MAYSDGPTGVGGWMVLFLFGFGFVSPIRMAFETYTNLYGDAQTAAAFAGNWSVYQVFSWVLVVLTLALIAYIVWRLFKVHNPRTVQLTIIAVPLLGFGPSIVDILVTNMLVELDWSKVWAILTPGFVQSAVYCAIWCTYFKVSKRVKNTYVDRTDEEAAAVFQ
jgi:uncharacterized membrane protein